MKLSAHFDLSEFHSKDGQEVPQAAYGELRDLCRRFLEPLRRRFGPTTILSGYRSPRHNEAVGGAPRSFHRYDIVGRQGVAADVHCARGTAAQWSAFLEEKSPGGLGKYPGFVHVDTRFGRARW